MPMRAGGASLCRPIRSNVSAIGWTLSPQMRRLVLNRRASLAESLVVFPISRSPPGLPAARLRRRLLLDRARNALAARLVDILASISGRDPSQLSRSTTFLEQGMDSLSLTQVAFAIRKEFAQKVSFSQLMKDLPNADLLAAYLDQSLPPEILSEPVPEAAKQPAEQPFPNVLSQPDAETKEINAKLRDIVSQQARIISRLVAMLENNGVAQAPRFSSHAESPAIAVEPLPVPTPQRSGLRKVESTFAQRGIYFSSRFSDHLSACYNESMTLYVRGTVSVPKLTRAVERLVQRHDALRACFDESGTTMQIAPMVVKVPVVDLSGAADAAERERQLQELIAKETARPFRLPQGPLFRSQIVRLTADSAAVVFTGHHTICDGWSLDVLVHDLCAFYSEELSGNAASLPAVSGYADYVNYVNERAGSAEFSVARQYWREKFTDGFHALVLPTDGERPGRRQFAANHLERRISASLVHDLRKLAAEQGCSFFAVTLAALSLVLARISRQRSFVIALPTAEQPAVGQPNLVGHCVNMVPFAVELREGEAASAFLARTNSDVAAAHDHAAFALVNLLEDLHPTKPVHGVVSISAGLTSVKKWNLKDLPQSGFAADYAVNPKSFESLELYLNAVEVGDGLELKCQYDQALFAEAKVGGWLASFEQVLQELVIDTSREVLQIANLNSGRRPPVEAVYALTSNQPEAVEIAHEAITYVAPRSETEKILTGIWKEVLRTENIGIHDDFFELGGQSLSAVSVTNRIEAAFKTRLPLAALLEAPTIQQLARLLDEKRSKHSWSPLVTLERSGAQRPVFLFHSHGGNVLEYRALARRLGKDRPVYALQSRGLDGSKIEEPRVEEMAAYYLEEIRSVQPRGPYYLGGFCLGGIVALEAARRLQESGELVDLVFMINSATAKYVEPPSETGWSRRHYYLGRQRLALEWNNLSNHSLGQRAAYVSARAKRVAEVFQIRSEIFWESLRHRKNGHGSRHSLTYHLEQLAMAYDRAWKSMNPSLTREGFCMSMRNVNHWESILIRALAGQST